MENDWKYSLSVPKYEKSLVLHNTNDFSVTTIVSYNRISATILQVEVDGGKERMSCLNSSLLNIYWLVMRNTRFSLDFFW